VTSRALRASLTAVELIRSNSSSRKWWASLRRFAPKLFVSISSAPALMKPTCSETTASGARRFASSGVRRRGTAAETSAPMPPSATIVGPLAIRSRKRLATLSFPVCARPPRSLAVAPKGHIVVATLRLGRLAGELGRVPSRPLVMCPGS